MAMSDNMRAVLVFLKNVQDLYRYSGYVSALNIKAGVGIISVCVEDLCDLMYTKGLLDSNGKGQFKLIPSKDYSEELNS